MTTAIIIIVICTAVGGIIAFISSGGKKDAAVSGAMAGATTSLGCLVQILIAGIVITGALILFRLVFG